MRKVLAIALTLLVLASCRKAPEAKREPSQLPTELSAKAEHLPAGSTSSTPAPASSPGAGGSPGPVETSTVTDEAPLRTVGERVDPANDAGLTAPGYADLTLVRVEENATQLRVVVEMRDRIPTKLPEGDDMGIGINLYVDATSKESDYQIFAYGGPDGWFAFLTDPSGFVDYPGTFKIGDKQMLFDLPLTSVGGGTTTAFDCFADWSTGSIVSQAGADHAPDSGKASISR